MPEIAVVTGAGAVSAARSRGGRTRPGAGLGEQRRRARTRPGVDPSRCGDRTVRRDQRARHHARIACGGRGDARSARGWIDPQHRVLRGLRRGSRPRRIRRLEARRAGLHDVAQRGPPQRRLAHPGHGGVPGRHRHADGPAARRGRGALAPRATARPRRGGAPPRQRAELPAPGCLRARRAGRPRHNCWVSHLRFRCGSPTLPRGATAPDAAQRRQAEARLAHPRATGRRAPGVITPEKG